jgi:hypothetical protein
MSHTRYILGKIGQWNDIYMAYMEKKFSIHFILHNIASLDQQPLVGVT